jgi:hypothetical protein
LPRFHIINPNFALPYSKSYKTARSEGFIYHYLYPKRCSAKFAASGAIGGLIRRRPLWADFANAKSGIKRSWKTDPPEAERRKDAYGLFGQLNA